MCYMGTQLPLAAKGAFRSMSVVAKRSPISVTAELLVLLHDTAVVGNIHYTTCMCSSSEDFWKINWSFESCNQSCVVRPMHTSIGS